MSAAITSYRLKITRKAPSSRALVKPVNAVIHLNGNFTASQVARGVFEWAQREPGKIFIITNDEQDNATVIKGEQIYYVDAKPYKRKVEKEKTLQLTPQEQNRLRQFIN